MERHVNCSTGLRVVGTILKIIKWAESLYAMLRLIIMLL